MRRMCCILSIVGALGGGICLTTARAHEPQTVLVHNDPVLTRGMLDEYTGFIEWLYALEFSAAERTTLQRQIVRHWKLNHTDKMRSILQALETHRQVQAQYATAAERAVVREEMFGPILRQNREAARNDADVRWLLEVYDRAHQPLCEGEPPLTRRVLDARVELLAFLMRESDILPIDIDEVLKEEIADVIVARYPALAEQERQGICEAPRQWAAIQFVWQQASDADKSRYRTEWTKALMQGLSEPQKRLLQTMGEVRAIMRSIPPGSMRHQVLRAADQLERVARPLDGTDEAGSRMLRVLQETIRDLRAATSLAPMEEIWLRDEMTPDEWAAYQRMGSIGRQDLRFQISLRRVHRQHRAAMWMQCHDLSEALWTTGTAYRYPVRPGATTANTMPVSGQAKD